MFKQARKWNHAFLTSSPASLGMLGMFFRLGLKAGGETTNWEDKSETNSFSSSEASIFLAKKGRKEHCNVYQFIYTYIFFKSLKQMMCITKL